MRNLTTLSSQRLCLALSACILSAVALSGCGQQRGEQHRLEGDAYFKLGKYAEATESYQRAAMANPQNSMAWLGQGRCLVIQGKLGEAAEAFKKALALEPSNEAACSELVHAFLQDKKIDEALAAAGAFEKVNPERGGVLCASVLLNAGRGQEAVDRLTALRGQFDKSPEVRVALAVAYMAAKQPDQAENELKTVLDTLKPDSVEAQVALANVHKMQGKLEAAVSELQDLVKRIPEDVNIKLALARCLLDAGKTNEAETLARGILTDNPGSGEANYVVGCSLIAKRQYEDAVASLERAVTALPTDQEIRQALSAAKSRGSLAPQHPALANVAPPAENEGDWKTLWQQAALGRLLQEREKFLANDEPNLRETLVLAAIFTNNASIAEELAAPLPQDSIIRKCVNLRSQTSLKDFLAEFDGWKESDEARRILRENALGYVLARAGARAQGISVFSECFKSWPDNVVSLYNIAQVYKDIQMPEYAARTLQRLVRRYPQNSDVLTLLYAIYRRNGMKEEARNAAEGFYGLFPNSREAILDLSQAYLDAREFDTAKRTIDRGLELLPADPYLNIALATVLLYAGKPEEARTTLKQIGETPELSGRLLGMTVLADAQLGDWNAIAEETGTLDAKTATSSLRLMRAAACIKMNKNQEAADALKAAEGAESMGMPAQVILASLGQPPATALNPEGNALAEKLAPDPDTLTQFAAAAAFEAGQLYDNAFELSSGLDNKLPENTVLLDLVFGSLSRARRVPNAAGEGQKLAERHADNAAAWLGYADVLRAVNDPEGQRKALEKAAELAPLNPEVWRLQGALLERQGDLEGQIRAYRKLLQITPDDAAANNNLAYCLLMKGENPQEALEYAAKSAAKLPGNAMALHTLGLAQMRTGDLEQSRKSLSAALELRPGDPELLLDYGQLLVAKGQKEEGLQHIRMAIQYADQLDVAFERRAEAEQALALQ